MLAVVDDALAVACLPADDALRLPAFDPGAGGGLDDAARASTAHVASSSVVYLEQLYTFTAGGGSEQRVVVSYLALAGDDEAITPPFELRGVDDAFRALSDVERIVAEYAVIRLRAKIGYTTIAFHLMAIEFTLSELQKTYETILGVPLDKRNFRRRMLASGLVSPTDGRRAGANHRPAALYQFTAEHNPSAFLTPTGTARLSS